ncbi:MAG: branched-chain amino acid transporter permease [Bacillota bacterium]
MEADTMYAIAVVLTVAAITFLTRAAPFALQSRSRTPDGLIAYLGKALPPAVMATLVVYALRNVHFSQYPNGLPEFIAIAVVAVLHLWKRNTLLSILTGTVVYMVLVQAVFTGR